MGIKPEQETGCTTQIRVFIEYILIFDNSSIVEMHGLSSTGHEEIKHQIPPPPPPGKLLWWELKKKSGERFMKETSKCC